MLRLQLNDGQWSKLALVLEGQRGAGRRAKDDRSFIEAVLWWRRTGVPWRDLQFHAQLSASARPVLLAFSGTGTGTFTEEPTAFRDRP